MHVSHGMCHEVSKSGLLRILLQRDGPFSGSSSQFEHHYHSRIYPCGLILFAELRHTTVLSEEARRSFCHHKPQIFGYQSNLRDSAKPDQPPSAEKMIGQLRSNESEAANVDDSASEVRVNISFGHLSCREGIYPMGTSVILSSRR